MATDTHQFKLIPTIAVLIVSATVAYGQQLPGRVCGIARPAVRPPGAPKASDVVMRTLQLHPRNKTDPHDTMQAITDFHVTRLEWSYVANKEFIDDLKASARLFGGAAAAPSYLQKNDDPDWFEKVVVLNLDKEPIIAPWKRTWNRTLWGCINNPELERGYLEYLKRYVDAGAEVMQRDEPGANYAATRWGGCFCPHCMKAFRRYLAENTTPEERLQLGITDFQSFDYRKHLKKQGAPVGDSFGRWDGGGLKELFVEFQTQATVAFHRRTRAAIDEYAGRHVPFSCNNGTNRWTAIELGFDWGFGELSYSRAQPDMLQTAIREAASHDRTQVLTMPKKGDQDNLDEWQQRTRQTIATAYACGGLCMVPWDVYMPKDAPRYFGTPERYADLFGFIRANAGYLDSYEEAAVAGKGLEETRYGQSPPVVLGNGGGEAYAFVRAKPSQLDAPVVVHLVSWAKRPKPFTIRLRTAHFFGHQPLKTRLLVPTNYDKAAHEKAEQSADYSGLSSAVDVQGTTEGEFTVLRIPPLAPWGILVVGPNSGS